MPYPPTFNPPDRANTTVSQNAHPGDHNGIRDALLEVVNELGADPSTTWASVQARLNDMLELQTSAGGDITGTQVMKGPMRFTKAIDIDTTLNVDGASTMGAITMDGALAGATSITTTGELAGPQDFKIRCAETNDYIMITGDGNLTTPADSIGFYTNDANTMNVAPSRIELRATNNVEAGRLVMGVDLIVQATEQLELQSGAGHPITVKSGTGVSTNLVPGAWTNIAPAGGWVNFTGRQPAQYRKVGDIVELRGTLSGGTFSDGTQVIATLPSGFRPPAHDNFPCASSGGPDGGGAYLYVTSTGAVQIWQATNSSMVGLNGVRFSTV